MYCFAKIKARWWLKGRGGQLREERNGGSQVVVEGEEMERQSGG